MRRKETYKWHCFDDRWSRDPGCIPLNIVEYVEDAVRKTHGIFVLHKEAWRTNIEKLS